MKNLKIFFLICLTLLLTNTAFSQGKFLGKVIEVIDGKTVVIELPTGKVRAVLQFIEVPEPEQPFATEIKNHLRNLTLGKTVEFKPLRVTPKHTVGLLTLDGVDISNQLLRDGAAWYALPEKSGQEPFESRTYQDNEKQARLEKRGVWGIENLKPSWELRAEADEKRRQADVLAKEEKTKLEQIGANMKPQKITVRRSLSSESDIWSQFGVTSETEQLPPNVKRVGGLIMGYIENAKIGFVTTPVVRFNAAANDNRQSLGVGVVYVYGDSPVQGRRQVFFVGVESLSKDFRFLAQNQMTVTVDGVKINLGKARRFAKKEDDSAREVMLYEIKRSHVEKIARAKNVSVKVGNFQDRMPEEVQTLLENMLQASN